MNSTHSKIKFYISCIEFFFYDGCTNFLRGGEGGVMLSVQKTEKNHKNRTHSKIKFYIIFIYIFFSMMYIKKILNGAGGLVGGGLIAFFYILLYYFINVMIKTLYFSNFIVVYIIYFPHSLYCYVLMFFSLLLKSYTFSARYLSSPTVFDLDVEPNIIL